MQAEAVRGAVYRALKTHGPLTVKALPDYTEIPISDIKPVVLEQIEQDLLGITPQGTLTILRPMNPPAPITPEESLQALTHTPHIVETPEQPLDRYNCPNEQYLPAWEQGQPPSCVGHSTAGLAFASYLRVTHDYPSPEDRIVRNVRSDGGFSYDKLYRPIPSPWWLYEAARKIGRMPSSAYGARTHDAIEVLQTIGSVPWNYCLTPKTLPSPTWWPKHGNDNETFEYLAQVASAHRVDRMATGQGFDAVCSLIQRYGAAAIEIQVYPSITGMRRDGAIPLPGAGEKSIGNHGILLYGFDRPLGIARYLNSWAGFPSRGTLPAAYIDRYAGLAFGIMDDQEPLMPPEEDPVRKVATETPGNLLDALKNLIEGR